MTTLTNPVVRISPQHPAKTTEHDERATRNRTARETERRERQMVRSALLMVPPR